MHLGKPNTCNLIRSKTFCLFQNQFQHLIIKITLNKNFKNYGNTELITQSIDGKFQAHTKGRNYYKSTLNSQLIHGFHMDKEEPPIIIS